MLYYGYRFYEPSTGRWLSRDPLDTIGFVVINPRIAKATNRKMRLNYAGDPYITVGNNLVNIWDYLGLYPGEEHGCPRSYGGMDWVGFAGIGNEWECIYQNCGASGTAQTGPEATGPEGPSYEKWVGDDSSGTCYTCWDTPAKIVIWEVCGGCNNGVLYYTPGKNGKVGNFLRAELSSTGEKIRPIDELPTAIVRMEPNWKPRFLCEDKLLGL